MEKSKRTAVLGIFTALIIVLQIISYFVKIGVFSITLTLIPIVLATVIYGKNYGAVLGAVFGAVTFVGCFTGIDAGGNMLFNASPLMTFLLCFIKATAAGYISGLAAQIFKKKNITLAVILAAVTAPIVNTGLFIVMMFLFFKSVLIDWAAGTEIAYYVVFSLVGINFVSELLCNVILSPVILRVAKVLRK